MNLERICHHELRFACSVWNIATAHRDMTQFSQVVFWCWFTPGIILGHACSPISAWTCFAFNSLDSVYSSLQLFSCLNWKASVSVAHCFCLPYLYDCPLFLTTIGSLWTALALNELYWRWWLPQACPKWWPPFWRKAHFLGGKWFHPCLSLLHFKIYCVSLWIPHFFNWGERRLQMRNRTRRQI